MKQYLVQFEHDSKRLGYDGFGQLLIKAKSFEEACKKVSLFSVEMKNPHHQPMPFYWDEKFTNARNFVNLTIE